MNFNYGVGKPYLFIEVVKQPKTPYVWVGHPLVAKDLEFKEHVLHCTRSYDTPTFDSLANDGQRLKYETFKTDLYSVKLCSVDHVPLSQQSWYKRSNTLVLAEYFSLQSKKLINVYDHNKELRDVFQDRYDRLQKSIKNFYGNTHES
jgi:hypothetical protein